MTGLRCNASTRAGVGLALVTLFAVFASISAPAAAAEASDIKPAVALLQKMHQAARNLDYSGVYTYQQGSTVLSTQIVHIVDGTGERERISLLDGHPREYIRHNETTQCLLPEHKVVLVEHRDSDRFPAVLFDEGQRLPAHYKLELAEVAQRVAGRPCRDLTLTPRDAHRYAFRLCADQDTGLLLRAQAIGPEGVMTQVVFNKLEIGKDVNAEALSPAWSTKDWKVIELPVREVDLASEGWRIPLPPGYEPLKQVVREMNAGRQVKQLVASDGLSSISVFIEAYSEADGQPRDLGVMRKGALSVYRKRIGDHWLTVLGEVPADTVHDLAQRTEYVPLAVR